MIVQTLSMSDASSTSIPIITLALQVIGIIATTLFAFLNLKVARKNMAMVARVSAENRVPHFRAISQTINDHTAEFTIRLKNVGGPLILESWHTWLTENIDPTANETFELVNNIDGKTLFPNKSYQTKKPFFPPFPAYIEPEEEIVISFKERTGFIHTGSIVNYNVTFWDVKAGAYKTQLLYGNAIFLELEPGIPKIVI